jgi:hypothetical protein
MQEYYTIHCGFVGKPAHEYYSCAASESALELGVSGQQAHGA